MRVAQAIMPAPLTNKNMKAQYEAVFTAAVIAKVKAAQEMGIKASWRTQDHLAALADCITKMHVAALERQSGENEVGITLDVLTECYNVSAFQQSLAKKFAATGHFQRTAEKSTATKVDELVAFANSLKA